MSQQYSTTATVPPDQVERPSTCDIQPASPAPAAGAGAATARLSDERTPVRALNARMHVVVCRVEIGKARVKGILGTVVDKIRAPAAAALAHFHKEPGPYAVYASDADADHASSAAHTKPRQSNAGKRVAWHRNEKEGLEAAAAL